MESKSFVKEADGVPVAPTDDQSEQQQRTDDPHGAEGDAPPIPVIEAIDAENPQRNPFRHLGLMHPSENYKFNLFLNELGSHISEDELHKLKLMFVGEVGKRHLENIKMPEDLFTKMRELSFLSENNLVYLQAILKTLNRPELIEMTIEHSRKTGGVLHFTPESNEPVNGYRYVKFHLIPDKPYDRRELRQLQNMVSEIVGVPAEFVLIARVEPTSSLNLTIMIPKMYADILEKYLDNNRFQDEFAALKIDTVYIGTTTFTIKDGRIPATKRAAEDSQIVSLYNDLTNKTMQLDVLKRKHEELKKKYRLLEDECILLEVSCGERDDDIKHVEETYRPNEARDPAKQKLIGYLKRVHSYPVTGTRIRVSTYRSRRPIVRSIFGTFQHTTQTVSQMPLVTSGSKSEL